MSALEVPLVSFVVPVYNTGTRLSISLGSLLDQTLRSVEIILVDDGSTDAETITLLDQFSQRDDRIRLFRKENGGQSSARNYGLERATGEYVAFIDHDDFVFPWFAEKLYAAAKQYGAEVASGQALMDEHGNLTISRSVSEQSVITIQEDPELILRGVTIWRQIFSRNFLVDNFELALTTRLQIFVLLSLTRGLGLGLRFLSWRTADHGCGKHNHGDHSEFHFGYTLASLIWL